jgi:hypothetical protein
MAESLISRPKAILALGAAVLAMCVGVFATSPPSSQAFTTTVFCDGQWVAGWPSWCFGASRTIYADYGWGDQHIVCLLATGDNGVQYGNRSCSAGPGKGVYNALGITDYLHPTIENMGGWANFVHGRAYTP